MRRMTQVRFAVAFAVMAVVLGAVWLIPGGASTRTSAHAALSSDDCDALQDIGDEIPDVASAGNLSKAQLEATSEGMTETAKKIDDKKLKKALNTLGSIYKNAGRANLGEVGAVGVFVKNAKRYGKASVTFSKALLGCVTSNITIPTIPSNITLPGGITIPTLPR